MFSILSRKTFLLFTILSVLGVSENKSYATSVDSNIDTHILSFLPAPPAAHSLTEQNDISIFKKTRQLEGTERWSLAIHDADLSTASLLDDFSCSIGFKLDASRTPHLVELLEKMLKNMHPLLSAEKKYWHRERPFVGNDEHICVSRPFFKKPSFSYPSGHTTKGWAVALLLSRIIPSHASSIMERGRILGESRIICGVHWASDVWAGYMNGSVYFNIFMSQPDIQPMINTATQEVNNIQKSAEHTSDEICQTEKNASKLSPLTNTSY